MDIRTEWIVSYPTTVSKWWQWNCSSDGRMQSLPVFQLLLLWSELDTGSQECHIITELVVLIHTVANRSNPLDYQTLFRTGKLHVCSSRKSKD